MLCSSLTVSRPSCSHFVPSASRMGVYKKLRQLTQIDQRDISYYKMLCSSIKRGRHWQKGSFSKIAIAQWLAGHWTVSCEQYHLRHLPRFCYVFLSVMSFLFVLSVLSALWLQSRGAHVREGLCGVWLPARVNPSHHLIHWSSHSAVGSNQSGQVWFPLCQFMLTTPNYCLVFNVFGNFLKIIYSSIFTGIQVGMISL